MTDPTDPDDPGRIRSTFDEIVDGLDLDLPDDLDAAPPVPRVQPRRETPEADPTDFDDLPDEQFYREVGPSILPAMTWPTTLACVAVAGIPLLLVACTLLGVFLPRGIVASAAITCVAGAIWLFSRLPSRGRPDSPDDGAVL